MSAVLSDSMKNVKIFEIDPVRPVTDDWRKRCTDELGETDALRESALVEFKEKIRALPDMVPRLEDAFLTRFLRAKKFDQDKALKMYRNYFRVRLLDPTIYCPVGKGPKDHVHLYKLGVGYLLRHRNPINGACIIVWQFGDWTPETGYDLSHIYTPTQYAVDYALKDPEVQLNGFMFLINLIGMEWRYLKVFTPSAVRALISTAQDGYPARFKGAHIVNQSSVWNIIWSIGKPFLSYKIRDRVHLHGEDMSSLHQYIHPSVLPQELGGDQPPLSYEWFTKELYARHDEYVNNSHYGYAVEPQEDENTRC